jgi:hypothetical protein
MEPSIGRIAHYHLSEYDVQALTRRRVAKPHDADWPAGAQAHVGNPHNIGQTVPFLMVNIFASEYGEGIAGVNGQAFLDGNDVLWVTSAREGTAPGTWSWPERL